MNFKKFLFVFFVFSLALTFTANAQEKMTEEQWQKEMNLLTEQKAQLTGELNSLKTEIANLKAQYVKIQSSDDCMKEVYALLGINSKADLDNFRNMVNALEAKIDKKEMPKEDRQAELNQLKGQKVSYHPEFYDKVHNQLQRKLDAWETKAPEVQYTVVRGDCLWNIAKKKEHYANPFAWPKIYSANRDQIKNPDLIYPKQIFKIPNLTDEEKTHYDKVRRNYKPAPPKQEQAVQ
jgi:hypothetical protein